MRHLHRRYLPTKRARLGTASAAVLAPLASWGQSLGTPYFPSTSPAAAYDDSQAEPAFAGDNFLANSSLPARPTGGDHRHYNLKFGSLEATFGASLTTTYQDNILLNPGGSGPRPEGDLTLNPEVHAGLFVPLSPRADVHLDLGVGYRFNVNHPGLDTLSIRPGSTLDYQWYVAGVRLFFFENMGTGSLASTQPELVGNGSTALVNFSRFQDNAGLTATIDAGRDASVSLGYNFGVDVGLDDQFSQLDRITHSVSAAWFEQVGPRLTVGLSSSAFLNDYLTAFQNDSQGYGLGPLIEWRPTRYLTISANGRFTDASFGSGGGAIAGSTSFSGLTYDLSFRHTISRQLNYSFQFSKALNFGLGNNYNTETSYTGHLQWVFRQGWTGTLGVSFADFSPSGEAFSYIVPPPNSIFVGQNPPLLFPGGLGPPVVLPAGSVVVPGGLIAEPFAVEKPSFLSIPLSVQCVVNKHLTTSVGYSYQKRISNFASRQYENNLFFVTAGYQF